MADNDRNIFENSNCPVPEVRVELPEFVIDCEIAPAPPPVFECSPPIVPPSPEFRCPEFATTTTVTTTADGEDCPPTNLTLTIDRPDQENDPCRYDFDLNLNIAFPCPVINVDNFNVRTEQLPRPDLDGCPIPACESTFTIVKKEAACAANSCEFDVALDLCIPIPTPPCPTFNVTNFNVRRVSARDEDGNCEARFILESEDQISNYRDEYQKGDYIFIRAEGRRLRYMPDAPDTVPSSQTDSVPGFIECPCDPCESSFSITKRAEQCEDSACEFDVSLDICVPEPPCPRFNITTFNVRSVAPELISEDGENADENACQSRFKIERRNVQNCDEESDQCEFDVELELCVPCPQIKITSFSVTSQFTGDDCCQESETQDIIDVACREELAGLLLAVAAIGSIARVPAGTTTGSADDPENPLCTKPACRNEYWKRISAAATLAAWESTSPPEDKCENKFTITTCSDGDQCEFDIDLSINVPIPRTPCPQITVNPVKVTAGFEDSDCAGCRADQEVSAREDLANIEDPKEGMYVKVGSVASAYEYGGNGVWTPTEVPQNGDITVENEDALAGLDPPVGAVAKISNPSDRFQYRDGSWRAAPCPKNKFGVTTHHRPPVDCDDPGECSFEFDLEISVLLPKPPCPEINIDTFDVLVIDKACAEADPEKCKNRFEITSKKLSNKIKKRLESLAERDDLVVPGDVELDDLVAVKNPAFTGADNSNEPEFYYWRAIKESAAEEGPYWAEVFGKESCPGELDGGDTCSFDVDLEICVAIPSVPCPEINVKSFNVRSVREECLLADPEFCQNKFEITTRHETNEVKEVYASVAELNAVVIPAEIKLGEMVATRNPAYNPEDQTQPEFYYWRAIEETSEPEGPYWAPVEFDPDACEPNSTKCIFDVDLDICIPIICPEFTPRVKVRAFYDDEEDENCEDEGCDADIEIAQGAPLPNNDLEIGQTLIIRAADGRLVSRLRWAPGWIPAPCKDSSFIIAKRPLEDCVDEDQPCQFDVVLEIAVPIPRPPCPVFNSRQHRVEICDTNFPRSFLTVEQREINCEDDKERRCAFDIDFNLEIPCPTFRGAGVGVDMTGFGGASGGSVSIYKNACTQKDPEIACDEYEYFVNDVFARDQLFYGLAAALGAAGTASLLGTVIKTAQPLSGGALWRLLSVNADGRPEWLRIVCDPEAKNVCEFDIDLNIQVPGCAEINFEEDDAQGTVTGIKEEDKLKIFYLLSDKEDPPPGVVGEEFDECKWPENCKDPADADRQVANNAAADDLLGEKPGIPAGVDYRLAAGQVFVDNVNPADPTTWIYYELNADPNPANRNLVIAPITAAQVNGRHRRPLGRIRGGLAEVQNNLGTAPQVNAGDLINVAGGNLLEVVAGADGKLRLAVVPQCKKSLTRIVILPKPNEPCTYVYQTQTVLCLKSDIHKAKCTNYYGDPCCDTEGCPCSGAGAGSYQNACCDENVDDGYYKTDDDKGEDYDRAGPAPFRARPETTFPANLPRLANAAAAESQDCEDYVNSAGSGCNDGPATDKGYRPFKALELNVVNRPHKDRTKPPIVEHQIDAAINCLHGGEVTIKAGTKPAEMRALPTMGVTGDGGSAADGDLGEGTITIENNRVNLELTLYTKECPTNSGGGSGSEEFRAPIMATRSGPTLTPALLKQFISAIKTDPELKAAIRDIVNQPDD